MKSFFPGRMYLFECIIAIYKTYPVSYFTPAFQTFFRDLSKNNTTAWFDENRKTYEREVKQPFSAFVTEMITRIKKFEPEISIKAADAISRINKDIRFSKDKTPYNTFVSANISAFGKKSKSYPGFFFRFSREKISVIGGSYILEPDEIEKIRRAIIKNSKEFSAAIRDKNFIEKFEALRGEQNKKLPPEFAALASAEPLIANKQFYYTADMDSSLLLKSELPDELMEYYKAGKNVNTFLKNALK